MEERRIEIGRLKTISEEDKETVNKNILKIENEICEMVAEDNSNKVKDNFKVLTNPGGMCNTNGMWSLKQKYFLKIKKPFHLLKWTAMEK